MSMVSILVLSKNNGNTLGRTLVSILKSKLPPHYLREIIVIDAHSNDNTPNILSLFSKHIRVIYDEGKGIGIARNLGVLSAKGDIICFVDADCVVGEDHFVKIIQAIEKGADVVDVRGGLGFSETLFEKLENIVWMIGRAYSEELIRDRCFAGGAFISFRREVFNEVGGFWTYPPYGGDDIDFSYRAYRRGFKIKTVYVSTTYSRHRRGPKELIKQQIGWGKGYSHIIAKYRNDTMFWKCYKWNNLVYRFLGNMIFLYPIVAALMAPIRGLILAIRTSILHLLPYWIIRRWAFLLGMLSELRKALTRY